MKRRRFSQTSASEWQTAFVVSHKMPWCTLITAVKNYNKSLGKLQDFSSRPRPRPRPRPNVQDQHQDQDFMIQDQDQDFHFCPRGASRPRPWSRGLLSLISNHVFFYNNFIFYRQELREPPTCWYTTVTRDDIFGF